MMAWIETGMGDPLAGGHVRGQYDQLGQDVQRTDSGNSPHGHQMAELLGQLGISLNDGHRLLFQFRDVTFQLHQVRLDILADQRGDFSRLGD